MEQSPPVNFEIQKKKKTKPVNAHFRKGKGYEATPSPQFHFKAPT